MTDATAAERPDDERVATERALRRAAEDGAGIGLGHASVAALVALLEEARRERDTALALREQLDGALMQIAVQAKRIADLETAPARSDTPPPADAVERVARWLFDHSPIAPVRVYGWDDTLESTREGYRAQAADLLAVVAEHDAGEGPAVPDSDPRDAVAADADPALVAQIVEMWRSVTLTWGPPISTLREVFPGLTRALDALAAARPSERVERSPNHIEEADHA